MVLIVLAYLGGMLTIISPCILPVLPFVFARAGQHFRRHGLPLLLGMAITFAVVASLATVGGSWAVQANEYGRTAALVLLAFFGLTLLWTALADRLTRPLVRLGERLSVLSGTTDGGGVQSFVLGIATGFLWAPCAGPILGLLLTSAALRGANTQTPLLLLAYAMGAVSSLALALLASKRVFVALKRSLGAEVWIRRVLGAAVLIGVAVIAFGLDRSVLTALSLANTTQIEQSLLNRFHAANLLAKPTVAADTVVGQSKSEQGDGIHIQNTGSNLSPTIRLPDLSGAVAWLNSPPIDTAALRGQVVLIDFWTYSCINCLRTLPYINAWAEKYKDQGLVVLGIHTPEFAFEKTPENVRKAVRDLGIHYPVALDNNYTIWRALHNEYWPAHYFFDAKGHLRHTHFGEGEYVQSEQILQRLLAERNGKPVSASVVQVNASGKQAQSDTDNNRSPETYIGYARSSDHFVSVGGYRKAHAKHYVLPNILDLNDWGLVGDWTVRKEQATLMKKGGRIAFRFHARDLHLVLGPSKNNQPVRFRVTLDEGNVPGEDAGEDVNALGEGVVTTQRLYQLIRQKGTIRERTFVIEFLDPQLEAFSFTFG
ncbi:MAG: cytochrome c biogenesis protein DipZ [Ottowia sp.]|nr:cytochrome c biogenesis protein DipZ [Ottowia sp.]